jgi:hypothetical protein
VDSERPRSGFSARDPVTALGYVGALDGRGRTPDPLIHCFGEIGQACCFVDGVADNRVFVTVFGADVPANTGPADTPIP